MASSISQGLVLTTAMVFSTTVLYLAFSWQKPFQFQTPDSSDSNKQFLRSCLYSEDKKKERKKKKRVKFATNVMVKVMVKEEETVMNEEIETGEEQGRKKNRASVKNCRNEIPESRGMPANRIALYSGILRDRGHRIACCH